MLTRLSSKGQVVIPKAVREALGLRAGTRFHIQVFKDKIILEPIEISPVNALYGKYPDADFLSGLEEEHRREVEREDAIRPSTNCL